MATNYIIEKVTDSNGGADRIASTFYGTCSTAAGTAQKAVTISDSCTFNDNYLITGVTVHVKFTYSNTHATPTLKVGTATAKQIMAYGTTKSGTTETTSWYAGSVVSFTYDGTYWVQNDYKLNTNTTYTGTGLISISSSNVISTTATANTGDVVGPSSSTTNSFASFSSTTGKAIKNSGYTVSSGSTDTTATHLVLCNDSRLSDSRTPSSHTHGNVQNDGTLQTTDVAIASGDKLVVTDSSNSSKIARTSLSFDGSTTTQALTKAGTFVNMPTKTSDLTNDAGFITRTIISGSSIPASFTVATGSVSPDVTVIYNLILLKADPTTGIHINGFTLNGTFDQDIFAADTNGATSGYLVDIARHKAGDEVSLSNLYVTGLAYSSKYVEGSIYLAKYIADTVNIPNTTISGGKVAIYGANGQIYASSATYPSYSLSVLRGAGVLTVKFTLSSNFSTNNNNKPAIIWFDSGAKITFA